MNIWLKYKMQTIFVMVISVTFLMLMMNDLFADEIKPPEPWPENKPVPPGVSVVPGAPLLSPEEAMWLKCFPPAKPAIGLDDVIKSFSVTDTCVPTILRILSNNFGLRCGIEMIPWKISAEPRKRVSLNVENMSVRKILDKLVILNPDYVWTSDGGYVNFVLRDAYEMPDYPFNTVIPEFEITDMPYAQANSNILLTLYKERGFRCGMGLRHLPTFGPRVTVSMKSATPRQILNEIARQTDMSWQIGGGDGLTTPVALLMARKFPVPEKPCECGQGSITSKPSTSIHWVGLRQALEGKGFKVHWSPSNYKVTAIKRTLYMELQVGNPQAVVNGTKVALDAAPKIVANRVQIPESFISQVTSLQLNKESAIE